MKTLKIILCLCLTTLLWGKDYNAIAQNTIERTAVFEPSYPDTLSITYQGISNSSKTDLEIYMKISAKNTPFEIYSTELHTFDSILQPNEPFILKTSKEEYSDSLVTWQCTLRFPYKAGFSGDDSWIVNTSHGNFYGSLHYIPRQFHVKQSFWLEYSTGIILALILAIVIASVVITLYIRKKKRQHLEELLKVEQKFQSGETINTELRKKVETLYSDRWNSFNHLCDEYFLKKDAESENIRLSVYKELERQMENMRRDDSLSDLENIVNTYNDNLMERLRSQIPNLTKKEIVFLTYLYSGFSPKAICLFTDSKIKNFYNRRTRLRDKILASDAPDRELFASRMELTS